MAIVRRCTCLQERAVEIEGHQRYGRWSDVGVSRSRKDDSDWFLLAFFVLQQYLSTGPAGGDRFGSESRSVVGGDGYGRDFLRTPLGSGREQGNPFGAQSRRIGRILLVVSGYHPAVVQQKGRSHIELRIGGIGVTGRLLCPGYQVGVGSRQFMGFDIR